MSRDAVPASVPPLRASHDVPTGQAGVPGVAPPEGAAPVAGHTTGLLHHCAGERLHLLADPALYWPAQQTLLVADVHLGKAAAFRALGQPVPSGTTASTLHRLDMAVRRTGARHLVVLGDLLHSRHAHEAPAMTALHDWRARHAELAITLVRGNHDDRAGDPPQSLGMTLVDEPFACGPFALCHHPQAVAGAFSLAGHVHPATVLVGPGRERLRLPCFDIGPAGMVLPAFGDFTGAHVVRSRPGHVLAVVADGQVLRVP
ncbi:ligase-associated DNA damage response endonuclease PdeM [Achromobacter sp. GG226]|uniref:ligase-associated DNA damage response endonuclease PdeM n=1 Tax=Verticiella alkaliphila TaxID=2779529 RepID=UPI001C0D9BA6|nr:ligase-associated DNA damage response endonuclease PdeM [Verticiella sp. GG226]MBU4611819.1 ligase-associated DNA damage response endonuclease PdeM [Verticiella sp. GG226]